MEIEILCATMHQKDLSKYNDMHISGCNVIYANQAGRYAYQEERRGRDTIKMLTTATVGVGKNRNLALTLASGDVLLFADDDVVYHDPPANTVKKAFERYPMADVMIFGMHLARNGMVYSSRIPKEGRLRLSRAMRYGTYAIAVRRKSLDRCNLRFTELFGGGCLYAYGEDSDFLMQCFRNGLKIYGVADVLGVTHKDYSTCRVGYGEKYFFDKGALARHSFGVLAIPFMLRMALKKLDSPLSFASRVKWLAKGYRDFPSLTGYQESFK